MVITGYYINVFKEGFAGDYVILNEPNDEPTPEEVTKIEEVISKLNPSEVEVHAVRAIEDLNLNCTRFGFRVGNLNEY